MGYLDLTPQQIVNAYRLGITDRVLNSKMAWDCFMCFKCQEHCPKEIPVAEMMYELRNRGYKELRKAEAAQRDMIGDVYMLISRIGRSKQEYVSEAYQLNLSPNPINPNQ